MQKIRPMEHRKTPTFTQGVSVEKGFKINEIIRNLRHQYEYDS